MNNGEWEKWQVAIDEAVHERNQEVNSMILGYKESNMNKVKMRLEDGVDILTKTVEMTDIMVQYLSNDRVIMILDREMTVAHLNMSDTKWTAHILFKQKTDKDETMSKREFVELQGEGWTLDD